jgi:hypothetical protein
MKAFLIQGGIEMPKNYTLSFFSLLGLSLLALLILLESSSAGVYDRPLSVKAGGASGGSSGTAKASPKPQTGIIPRNAPGTPFKKNYGMTKSWTKNGVTSGPANVPTSGFRFKLAYPVTQTITEEDTLNTKINGISTKPTIGFDYVYLGRPYELGFAAGVNWTPERDYFEGSFQNRWGEGPDVQDFSGELSLTFSLENNYYLGAGGNYTYTLFSSSSIADLGEFSSEYAPGYKAFFGYQNRLGLGIEFAFESKRLSTSVEDKLGGETANISLTERVDSFKIQTSILF